MPVTRAGEPKKTQINLQYRTHAPEGKFLHQCKHTHRNHHSMGYLTPPTDVPTQQVIPQPCALSSCTLPDCHYHRSYPDSLAGNRQPLESIPHAISHEITGSANGLHGLTATGGPSVFRTTHNRAKTTTWCPASFLTRTLPLILCLTFVVKLILRYKIFSAQLCMNFIKQKTKPKVRSENHRNPIQSLKKKVRVHERKMNNWVVKG